jgi:hypothetical protein
LLCVLCTYLTLSARREATANLIGKLAHPYLSFTKQLRACLIIRPYHNGNLHFKRVGMPASIQLQGVPILDIPAIPTAATQPSLFELLPRNIVHKSSPTICFIVGLLPSGAQLTGPIKSCFSSRIGGSIRRAPTQIMISRDKTSAHAIM